MNHCWRFACGQCQVVDCTDWSKWSVLIKWSRFVVTRCAVWVIPNKHKSIITSYMVANATDSISPNSSSHRLRRCPIGSRTDHGCCRRPHRAWGNRFIRGWAALVLFSPLPIYLLGWLRLAPLEHSPHRPQQNNRRRTRETVFNTLEYFRFFQCSNRSDRYRLMCVCEFTSN